MKEWTVVLPAKAVSPSHDYHPSQDYEADGNVLKDVVAAAGFWLRRVKRLASLLGLPYESMQLYFARNMGGDHLARYVDGTGSSGAVIVMDARALVRQSKKAGLDLSVAVQTTLVHEMGHAALDVRGLRLDSLEEERLAELLAFEFFDSGGDARDAAEAFLGSIGQVE